MKPKARRRSAEREGCVHRCNLSVDGVRCIHRMRFMTAQEGESDNGLGALAGTWRAEDLAEFEEATRCFEAIDEDLWLLCGAAVGSGP